MVYKNWFVLVILMLLLSACSNQTPNVATATPFEEVYPAPGPVNQVEQAYPPASFLPTLKPGELPEPPAESLKPDEGKSALNGVLYSYTIHAVIPGTVFYLTRAVGENNDQVPLALLGQQETRGDIAGSTDENGFIQLNNIEPGNYYMVVWAPLNWAVVETEAQNQTPLLIKLEANESVNLGIAYVSWP